MIQKTLQRKTISNKRETGNKFVNLCVIGGMLFLAAFLLIVHGVGQDTQEFDLRVELEVERIHNQILTENYADVYAQASKRLITSFDRNEFENLLRGARPQLVGTINKSCTTFYSDMFERLKRNLGGSFQLETVCRLENETLKTDQYFDWRVNDNEMRLIWFGASLRK